MNSISEKLPAALVEASTAPVPVNGTERHFRYWSWWLVLFVTAWTVGYFCLAQDPIALFRRNCVFIPVGFCGAILGNISAVGGGIVFIPVIIFLFHLPPVTALKIALASQSWGMTSGAIGWIQKRVVPLRALKLTVPGLLLGSSISSLVIHPSPLLVKLLFGPVSILLGALTIVLSRKAMKSAARRGTTRFCNQPIAPLVIPHDWLASAIFSAVTGGR